MSPVPTIGENALGSFYCIEASPRPLQLPWESFFECGKCQFRVILYVLLNACKYKTVFPIHFAIQLVFSLIELSAYILKESVRDDVHIVVISRIPSQSQGCDWNTVRGDITLLYFGSQDRIY
jgi:hypothetical protein